MKNVLKAFGIIAFVAVIGFSMAACDEDSGGGGGINGTWRNSNNGMEVNISGSTGTIRVMGSLGSLWQNAYNSGYIGTGTQYFRNIRSTGSNSWSGEVLTVTYYTSAPYTATGTNYRSCTFSLSYDGRNLTVYASDSQGSQTQYFSRY